MNDDAHPTTLMQLTTRCGIEAVRGRNEALLAKAAAGEAVAHQPIARRHHGGLGQGGPSDRFGADGQGGAAEPCHARDPPLLPTRITMHRRSRARLPDLRSARVDHMRHFAVSRLS